MGTTWALVVATLVLMAPTTAGATSVHAPVHVPELVGRSRAAVYRTMRDDGLYFVTRGPGSVHADWGSVTAQSPRAGTLVPWHSQIVVTVVDQAPRVRRRVPRLVGLTRAEVFAAMRAAQLYFRPVGSGSTSNSWATVLAQSPRAGTLVPWHALVTVRVGARARVAVKKRVAAAAPTHGAVKVTSVVISGAGFKVGVATWYDYIPGQCATWYLPKGTRITVRDLTTGRSLTCVITDRESAIGTHVVDLSAAQFAELAPLTTGVISVKVTW